MKAIATRKFQSFIRMKEKQFVIFLLILDDKFAAHLALDIFAQVQMYLILSAKKEKRSVMNCLWLENEIVLRVDFENLFGWK